MQKGEYKKTLFEVFEAFGFSEKEKKLALEDFKKKLANELFASLKNGLPKETQEWIADHLASANQNAVQVFEIQKTIRAQYAPDVLEAKSRAILKRIMSGYIDFMSRELSLPEDKKTALKEKAQKF